MTYAERALQFRSVLAFAATEQKVISYGTLENLTGMDRRGAGQILGHIGAFCKKENLPMLNCLVVNQSTGSPGSGVAEFFGDTNVFEEQRRAFVYDWLERGAPSVTALEEAYKSHFEAVTR